MNDLKPEVSKYRKAERTLQEEAMSIKPISPPDEFSYLGDNIYCSTIDISINGMQIGLEQDLPSGWDVEIWIVTNHGKTTFNLKGKIIWVKEYEGDEDFSHCAGIALEDTKDSHFEAWQNLFEETTAD